MTNIMASCMILSQDATIKTSKSYGQESNRSNNNNNKLEMDVLNNLPDIAEHKRISVNCSGLKTLSFQTENDAVSPTSEDSCGSNSSSSIFDLPSIATKPCNPEGHSVLDVECGSNFATLHLDRLFKGSRSPSVFFKNQWLTPNEFQCVSGRQTAKDWKRSMRHHGRSLKMLMGKGVIHIDKDSCQTRCFCDNCTGIPHEALKDIPAQRGQQRSPTESPTLNLPPTLIKTKRSRRSRSKKGSFDNDAGTQDGKTNIAVDNNQDVLRQQKTDVTDDRIDCTDTSRPDSVESTDSEEDMATRNSRSLLKKMLLEMCNGNASASVTTSVTLPTSILKPLGVTSEENNTTTIPRSKECNKTIQPVPSNTSSRRKISFPKRGRLLNIINNLRSNQGGEQKSSHGDAAEDKVSLELDLNPAKHQTEEPLNESKRKRLKSDESKPDDECTAAWTQYWVKMLDDGSQITTATSDTSLISTCRTVGSGTNKTETVYSQIGHPRSSPVEHHRKEEEAIALHRYFAPFYQHGLRLKHKDQCNDRSSEPLPIHSSEDSCRDKHCLQMNKSSINGHSLINYHHQVAQWAMENVKISDGVVDLTSPKYISSIGSAKTFESQLHTVKPFLPQPVDLRVN